MPFFTQLYHVIAFCNTKRHDSELIKINCSAKGRTYLEKTHSDRKRMNNDALRLMNLLCRTFAAKKI